jgi:hypothetical protein
MNAYWRGFIPFDGTTTSILAAVPGKYAVWLGLS